MMDPLSRARSYVAKCPPAVSGQNGHAQTFSIAVALTHGFCLSDADAMAVLLEYNRSCQPPWSDADLAHKLKSASETPHDKPRGWLLGDKPPNRPVARSNSVTIPIQTALPAPIPDSARALLTALFKPGEGVRIVPARLNDEQREIPDGDGPTLSREEWLRKLDARAGNPNGIFRSDKKTGIYIGINPLKLGGSKDADVTAFRHALIEFDGLSAEEQFNLYVQSNLPCAAVISSGGKSIHAWVRVDAKDRAEYNDRVKVLYEHFAPYGLDGKNKNPSRLSRLPNCVRFERRQELLALNIGAPSFSEWLADKEVSSLGQEITLKELLDFNPDKDPNCILGNRWLCRGASCMWIGQSGIGKSSLAMQAAVSWALERPFFGVAGEKPLKSLFVQHENDVGDLSEMLVGVLVGLGVHAEPTNASLLKERLVIIRERTHTGQAFLPVLQRLIERHRPDLVWIDPLYTYIGDDISSQKVCSEFLCGGLGPITEATGVTWMMMHHTAKPVSDPKARRGWTSTDKSYLGQGSAVLTNWIRAAVVLSQRGDDGTFELLFGKRGRRAGAKDHAGAPTVRVFLKHSTRGIFWEQIEAPKEVTKSKRSGGRPAIEFNPDKFLSSMAGEHLGYGTILERIEAMAECSERKAKDLFREELKHQLIYDADYKTYTVKPA